MCYYRLFAFLLTWITARSSPLSSAVQEDLPILIPDLSNVDSYALQNIHADKFLTLWHINVLSGPTLISDEPWTVLIPQNAGLPKDPNFIIDTEYTRQILLNHVVIGDIIKVKNSPKDANLSYYSLADTELKFTSDGDATYVNGVRLTGDVLDYKNGKIYAIEKAIDILQPDYLKFMPDLKEDIFSSVGFFSKNEYNLQSSDPPKEKEVTAPTKSEGPRLTRFEKFRNRSLKESSKLSENVEKSLSGGTPNDDAEQLNPDGEFSSSAGFSNIIPEPRLAEFSEALIPNETFLESLEREASTHNSPAREFYHHFMDAELNRFLMDDQSYTAVIGTSNAFYSYYPIDWGFNAFLVKNFTEDVLLNLIIPGNINFHDLKYGTQLTTLGGRIITVNNKEGNKIQVNGEPILPELEVEASRGRIYYVDKLLFVDIERVNSLRDQYPYLETGPLIAYPWPTSPFLSHLVQRLRESSKNNIFVNFLLRSSVTHRFPSSESTHDNYISLSYSAFVPTDEALRKIFTKEQIDNLQQPYGSLDSVSGSVISPEEVNNFVLDHLFHGYIMEKDLTSTGTLLSMAEKNVDYVKSNDFIKVGGASVIGKQQYLYDLGAIYIIDGPITNSRHLAPEKNSHSFETAQLPAPQTSHGSGNQKGITVLFPSNPSSGIRFPSSSDPSYRFETRTEVSFSRQLNNGDIVPVTKEEVEREKRGIV